MQSTMPTEVPVVEKRAPVFGVACGRSGTHFIAKLMSHEASVASFHLDDINASIADSFLTYCAWNGLAVDLEGFFRERVRLIHKAAQEGKVYFEANPYLAFSVKELAERFHAKFVYLVRDPRDTVNSHYIKGWYNKNVARYRNDLALGFQYNVKSANHFFGRIVPKGPEFDHWSGLTRIGKISWMWNVMNMAIFEALQSIPSDQYTWVKLERLDYDRYLEISSYIGGTLPVTRELFEETKQRKPGKGPERRTVEDWSDREHKEFLHETARARALLGYEYLKE